MTTPVKLTANPHSLGIHAPSIELYVSGALFIEGANGSGKTSPLLSNRVKK